MLSLEDSASGKRALCPNCSTEFRAPGVSLSEGGTAGPTATAAASLSAGTNVVSGSLIRCPACDRTLAIDPSMVGQPIICPTCKRRMRVPTANEPTLPAASDLGYSPGTNPRPSPTNPSGFDLSLSPPFESNPYAATLSLPGSVPGMQTGTNYALPGAFLAILGALGVLFFAFSLLGAFVGIIGQQRPMVLDDFIFTFLWSATSIAFQLLTFIGGVQMIRRRQLGWAKLGAFAALYPCGSCVLVQLPVAIWALVILTREIAVYDFASPPQRHDLQSRR